MNKVIMIGNLANDPEARTTQSGISQSTFRIAVQRRFANQQGVREADFFTVIVWRQTADFCNRYLSKGRRVAVEGSIQNRSYDAQDGSTRYVTEIIADNVEMLDKREGKPKDEGFTEVHDDKLPWEEEVMDLKPCPFCAGDANWQFGHSRYGYYGFVKCSDCGASTKLVSIPNDLCKGNDFMAHDDFWESKPFQTATRLWNSRRRRKKEAD